MSDIYNFNDVPHRIRSASATFQKGIYHLFIQKYRYTTDLFAGILGMYQCLFQLCLTQLLLDSDFSISSKDIRLKRLRALCKDPNNPTRREIDPAAIVNHSIFEQQGNWRGFRNNHPLHFSSVESLNLLQRIIDARHNLVYRPFMLDHLWEDCTLIDLLETRPAVDEAESAYREFISGVLKWYNDYEPKRHEVIKKRLATLTKDNMYNPPPASIPPPGPAYFLEQVFMIYEDRRDARPTESLLLTYARMLNPNDEELLESLKDYRNDLLDLERTKNLISLPEDWRIGDV
jgi:hypothetical protein